MITQFEERLSWVPRWCVVRTIQKQSTAEHSFRVAVSAPRIAIKYGFAGRDDYEALYMISRAALSHDKPEALSGDIASPAKGWFDSAAFEKHFSSRIREEYPDLNPELRRLIKVADLYEALVFVRVDQSLGNTTLRMISSDIKKALRDACGDNRDMYEALCQDADRFLEDQDSLR